MCAEKLHVWMETAELEIWFTLRLNVSFLVLFLNTREKKSQPMIPLIFRDTTVKKAGSYCEFVVVHCVGEFDNFVNKGEILEKAHFTVWNGKFYIQK